MAPSSLRTTILNGRHLKVTWNPNFSAHNKILLGQCWPTVIICNCFYTTVTTWNDSCMVKCLWWRRYGFIASQPQWWYLNVYDTIMANYIYKMILKSFYLYNFLLCSDRNASSMNESKKKGKEIDIYLFMHLASGSSLYIVHGC